MTREGSVSSSLTVAVSRYIRAHEDEIVDLLGDLVSIDSQWSNPDGVRQVGTIVGDGLADLGFDVAKFAQPAVTPERRWLAEVLAPDVRYEDLGETFLCNRGGTGDRVLLLGDLDTALAPLPGSRLRIDAGRAYGTGVADMKGGLVVLLWALRGLDALDLETPPLSVVLAGDEQGGSLGSSTIIHQAAADARFTLCLECARDGGNLMASRGHIGVGRLDVTGRAAHAGSNRDAGVNAIEGLARIVPTLNAISDSERGILVTVTVMQGGRRRSLVPDHASAVVDLRGQDEVAWQTMIDAVERVLEVAKRDGIDLAFRQACHRPGVSWTASTDQLVAQAQSVGHELGARPGVVKSMAAGSSAFAATAGSVVLDGIGPPGGALMTKDEYVEVTGLLERSALLAGLLIRLTKTSGKTRPLSGPRSVDLKLEETGGENRE